MLDQSQPWRAGTSSSPNSPLLFPAPITELEVPHNTQIRRAALLVFGKPGAILPEGDDIIEVPAPAGGMADDFMDLKDCLPLVVAKFASRGQTICIPTLTDNCGAVVAALAAGCTVIAADEEQRSSTTWSGGCQSTRNLLPLTWKASEWVGAALAAQDEGLARHLGQEASLRCFR